MEHVIPRHPHQHSNSVFCLVRSEAISLDRPNELSSVSGVEWSQVESSALGSQLAQLGSCNEIGDSQRGREAVNKEVEGFTFVETRYQAMTGEGTAN
jgi:hypothetical protein